MNISKNINIKITVFLMVCIFITNFLKIEAICNKKILQTKDNIEIAIEEFKTGHNEVLIIAPGWFMCKDSKPFKQMALDFSKNFDVITMDFRGHCESSGQFTFTSNEYEDLNAVIEYARKKYKKVYAAGFSLGSATAIITEYKYHNIDKLILVSPPTDFDKIENEMWRKEAFIPTLKKCELKTWFHIHPGKFWLEKIKPISIIESISPTPILIITGNNDPTIFPWHAKELYKKAKEPKKIIIYQNSIHAEDIYLQNQEKFIQNCTEWLKNSDKK